LDAFAVSLDVLEEDYVTLLMAFKHRQTRLRIQAMWPVKDLLDLLLIKFGNLNSWQRRQFFWPRMRT